MRTASSISAATSRNGCRIFTRSICLSRRSLSTIRSVRRAGACTSCAERAGAARYRRICAWPRAARVSKGARTSASGSRATCSEGTRHESPKICAALVEIGARARARGVVRRLARTAAEHAADRQPPRRHAAGANTAREHSAGEHAAAGRAARDASRAGEGRRETASRVRQGGRRIHPDRRAEPRRGRHVSRRHLKPRFTMSALAIEINDSGLAVANESQVLAVEPGFARIEGGRIVTGEQARARARLQPRQTSSRFWSALSMDLGSAGADIPKSAAELAFAQLESLWQRVGSGVTAVVLVVPGGYRTEQLGLLLGLAQECAMPVRALVDAAAAASVRPYPKRQLMYLDASLYRVSLSLLEQNGEAQVRAEHALAQGLAGIADVFARRIGEQFVRATRLDPFAHAETEQALFDGLGQWLEALQRDERVEIALKYRNEEFR